MKQRVCNVLHNMIFAFFTGMFMITGSVLYSAEEAPKPKDNVEQKKAVTTEKAKATQAEKAKTTDKAQKPQASKQEAKPVTKSKQKPVAKQPEKQVPVATGTAVQKLETTTRLLRYPDIYADQVVFVYAGDLWKGSINGGDAIRLTAHPGLELSPKFSPDGKWIAFTSQYDGDEQVFVIPSAGGVPRQLTWYPAPGPVPPRRGFEHQVLGWTADGKNVLFRSGRNSNAVDALTHLYTVSLDGGLPKMLPVPVAGMGDLSPDGKSLVYSPLFRDFRHWKRYEGGWAQYLLLYRFEDKSYTKIPTTPRTDRDPMFVGNNVYFVSDRDGTMNLYHYDVKTNKVSQCTKHKDWDLRWASSDAKNQIVYELGGELFVYNVKNGQEKRIPLQVRHDGLAMQPSRISVADRVESYEVAPGGKRLAIIARGELFTVPAEKGNTRNLSQSSGSHERLAVWSPDGKWIAYISDISGEEEIWLIDQAGKEKPTRLSKGSTCQLNNLQWSPDGTALSYTNANNQIQLLELKKNAKSGKPEFVSTVNVATDINGGPLHTAWSPCGQYLAYVLNTEINYSVVYIWNRNTKKSYKVTDEMFDNYSPTWDPNGNWLYFIGQREFYPQISFSEWNFAGNRFTSVFAMALRKEVKNLFAPESDEVEPVKEKVDPESPAKDDSVKSDTKKDVAKKSNPKKDGKQELKKVQTSKKDKKGAPALAKEKKPETPSDKKKDKSIDFNGIKDRIVRVPISSENYEGLSAAGDYLFYIKYDAMFYGRESSSKPALMVYDLKKRKESVYMDNISGYALSPDGTKLAVRQNGTIKLGPVGTAGADAKPVSTANLSMDLVPAEEWKEVFEEVWRRFRDYFYVKNMHGCDWNAIGEQYRKLLPYVAHRSDLTYVLTEMISELNVGHTYVEGGDMPAVRRPKSGLAGALFTPDEKSGRYKIAKIFSGQNEESKYRAPLREIGVNVAVGDYLFAIDGKNLTTADNPYRLLRNTGETVTWKVGKKPDGSDAQNIVYKPVTNEANLRYLDFVLDRMEQVNKKTNGKVGYIHIPNMGGDGAYEFIKWYYPQLRKEGLIIDDRSNGGGNISSWIIMRLNQKLLGTRFGSTRQTPTTYPTIANNAHMVCLINETSASDGDIFPYYFRKSGLGKLIGKRSWGGVVGISSRGPLVDGSTVYVPLSATNDEKGNYIIEGHGVDPDIVIDQDPSQMARGIDSQLDRAILEVRKQMEKEPRSLPKRPADPNKSRDAVKKY